jgi:hypothetical protein
MVTQIFNLITQSFVACVTWFDAVFSSSGFSGLLLAVVFFLMLKRYILDPLFKGAGSDKARKRNKE